MSWQLFIALRYLTAKRREKFISLISLISILGVAVGVAALIVVIAVMSGFDNDLKAKIIGTNSHIVVEADYGMAPDRKVLSKIANTEHVSAAAFFLSGQALIRKDNSVIGVMIKGIEPKDEMKVTKLGQYIVEGSIYPGEDGIILGSELADKLRIGIADKIEVISQVHVNGLAFRVSGIFRSGMYEYDMNFAYLSIPAAQRVLGVKGLVSGIEVRTDDAFDVDSVKRAIQRKLGTSYSVRTWMDLNKNFLSALKLEKTVMFLILTLIVIVACFNIASALIMTVLEKTKDIGILKAIGGTNFNMMALFALQGSLIGILGTALGTAAGTAMCYLLKTYRLINLPRDVYYIDKLPVMIELQDVTLIVLSSLTISLLATLYPAYKAAKLDPVEALRYE